MASPETPPVDDPKLVTPTEARAAQVPVPAAGRLEREDKAFWEHQRAMQAAESGMVGSFFGSKAEKAGNIASITVLICFGLIGLSYWHVADKEPTPDGFFKFLAILSNIITLAMGYMFGSSRKD